MREQYVYSFENIGVMIPFESLIKDIFHLGQTHPDHTITPRILADRDLIILEIEPKK